MGSDDGLAFEKPSHQVTLGPYCIDEFEVTVERYKACSDAGRCKRAGATNDWAGISEKERRAFDPLCNVRSPLESRQAPDQLRRLGDGRQVLPRAGRPPADGGRMGVCSTRPGWSQVPVG